MVSLKELKNKKSKTHKHQGYACYLCGQQYGNSSYLPHIFRCEAKWVKRESGKKEKDRACLPPRPVELDQPLPEISSEVDAFNAKMLQHWDVHSLVRCETCKRTFKRGVFLRHKLVCTLKNPSKTLKSRTKDPVRSRRDSARELEDSACPRKTSCLPGKRPSQVARNPKPSMENLSRVKSYVCYLCGRQFGSKSLHIHAEQCKKKWLNDESQRFPISERRKLPRQPVEMEQPLPTIFAEIDEFNNKMTEIWRQSTLIPCPKCKRTFGPEALKKHKKGCMPEDSRVRDLPGCLVGPDFSEVSGQAKTYMCYLCGREFGSKSLWIHIPSCTKKFMAAENKKDKKDRRKLPETPPELQVSLPTDAEGIKIFNQKMFAYWNESTLVPCPKCNRTFRPESLEKHKKGCIGHERGYSSDENSAYEASERPQAYTCFICGHQYGSRSLLIHIGQCQAKFQKIEAQKPRQERKKLPETPEEVKEPLPEEPDAIAAFNAKMASIHEMTALVPCDTCGRTFWPEALEKHKKGCSHGKNVLKRMDAKKDIDLEVQYPASYCCYLCGRQYGSQSLLIHIPKCLEKWEGHEQKKSLGKRRKTPQRPSLLDEPLPTTSEDIDKFNQHMMNVHMKESLVACDSCGRTFWPEGLDKHKKFCGKVSALRSFRR